MRWNWREYEGKPVVIEVFSAAEEVELYLNGQSAGRKAAGREQGYRAVFELNYEPGELRAVSYVNGSETGSCILSSASDRRTLKAEPERSWGEQLIYLPVQVTDEKGILAADVFDEITVNVQGAAELAGLGTGDYAPKYNYTDHRTRMYEGRALAVLKRLGEGQIKVTVESENYGSCTIEL